MTILRINEETAIARSAGRMIWANMTNHIIFSVAVPIPESTKTGLSRNWGRKALIYRGTTEENL